MFLLLSSVAMAGVITVLSPSIGAPEPGFTGEVAAGLSAARGNQHQTTAKGAAGFEYINPTADHQLLLQASGDYGVAFQQVISQNSFAHLRYRWAFLDDVPLVSFSFVQTEHNAFRSLLLRNLAGTGLEYRLWRADWTEAWVGSAVMVDHERLVGETTDVFVLRNSSFALLAVQLDTNLVLGSSTYFQPRLDELSDWRFLEELSLSGKFGEHFGWSGALTLSHDKAPPAGVQNTDLTLNSGLTYSW